MEKDYKYMVCTRCMTYNHSPYIKETLNGFAMQVTTFPVVYCIIDDASTDGEAGILCNWAEEHLALEDAEARHTHLDYGELIAAPLKERKNLLFVILLLNENHHGKKSKLPYITEWDDNARYLASCEGDDYWIMPDKLQKQVSFLEEHKEYSLSHTRSMILLESRNELLNDDDSNDRCIALNLNGMVNPEKIFHGYTIYVPTTVYRRDEFMKCRMEDPFLFTGGHFKMGDTQKFFMLARYGKVHYLPLQTTVYRKHSGSMSMQKSFKNYLRFTLSSWELNYYLSHKFNCSNEEKQLSFEEFGRFLNIYKILVPTYVSPLYEVLPLPVSYRNKYIQLVREYWLFVKSRARGLIDSIKNK